MKRFATTMLIAACGVCMAAPEGEVEFGMPDTGLMPSFASVEFSSRMGQRHGGSDMSWCAFRAAFPISDPRKSHIGQWRVNAALEAEATVFKTGGALDLRNDDLYTFNLPISFIRIQPDGRYFAAGISPCIAADLASVSRGWDVVAFARYQMKVSDTFTCSIGAAISPRFAKYSVIPMFGFSWTPTPEWEVRMERYRLSALYRAGERLQVGPYVAAFGGSWMVDTPAGDRIFRINGMTAGLMGEYDFHQGDEPKRIIFASIGMMTAARADFCERTAEKDHVETHHYKPGFVISAGVDFRF